MVAVVGCVSADSLCGVDWLCLGPCVPQDALEWMLYRSPCPNLHQERTKKE